MKIAHLIMAHTDFTHIERLVRKLSAFSDVFLHIDSSVDEEPLKLRLSDVDNCYFITNRYRCDWGGTMLF